MKTGDEYVLIDTGQVWHVKSFVGDQIVMGWQDADVSIECTCEEFLRLFDDLPRGKKRVCYPRILFRGCRSYGARIETPSGTKRAKR